MLNRVKVKAEKQGKYCENKPKHINTICGVLPPRKHDISTLQMSNRIMLCKEMIYVYCEYCKENLMHCVGKVKGY